MKALLVLLALYLFLVLIVLPIWTFIKIRGHNDELEMLHHRLHQLEGEISSPRAKMSEGLAPAPLPGDRAGQTPGGQQPTTVLLRSAAVTPPPPPAPVPVHPKTVAEPPLLPPVIAAPGPVRPVYTPPPPKPAINWEQFMAAKLFAWLGGFALLLGVAFFVKYSFDHNLISPEVRVAIGFVIGAGLIIGGIKLIRKGYTTPAQALVAAGVVSLYIVTFACRSIYHFKFFGAVPTDLTPKL
ncbi:MAG: DUF2339 domain-containing protein [Lacunisphaera sp.]|nr:DUF2339 domain-containing protein [Lacunisphaera sp.]